MQASLKRRGQPTGNLSHAHLHAYVWGGKVWIINANALVKCHISAQNAGWVFRDEFFMRDNAGDGS